VSRHSSAGTGPGRPGKDPEENGAAAGPPPRRKRVVLADSRAPVTVLRTVVELEEQTSYGEELVRGFIRIQLLTAVRLGLIAVVLLGGLPVLFFFVPAIADVTLAGVRLPWLLLGVAPFPLLFGIGYWYNVLAERHERDFVDMVEK
jgi:fatty acid desaturase